MNYYQFFHQDQKVNNWILFSELRSPPWYKLKGEYQGCICPKCAGIFYDKVFQMGFVEPDRIRAKGDIIGTDDGFICVNENAKRVIDDAKIGGINLKPLSESGWWVINVSLRVKADETAYVSRNQCGECGRARQVYGHLCCLTQISVPNVDGVFFSPEFGRGSSRTDRDVFVTEDVLTEFKVRRLRGGVFSRLLTASEYDDVKAKNAVHNRLMWPKGSQVVL